MGAYRAVSKLACAGQLPTLGCGIGEDEVGAADVLRRQGGAVPASEEQRERVDATEISALLESAYDFVEHSLEEAEQAKETEPRRWKFAIIDITTAVELFVKERLRREHEILIFSNIENGTGHTVSLDAALKRLRACRVDIEPEDDKRLKRARDIRNSIIHFSTQATPEQLRAAYVDLFEFAHAFHLREMGAELHERIGSDYWHAEAAFIAEFRRTFVSYQGETVHREWPSVLVEAQYLTHWLIDGEAYPRIPWGDPGEGWESPLMPKSACHDCMALPGQLHGEGCDMERCPRCAAQMLGHCCGEECELVAGPAITD